MADKKRPPGAHVAASEVRPERVNWLWGERIAQGTITVIAGRPDQGKGLFGAHLAADVSTGTGLAANHIRGTGARVLFSAAEDDDRMMTRPRVEAAGADLKKVFFWRFLLPRQGAELERILKDEKIALLIMDPFAAHLSGTSKYSPRIRDTVLGPLTEIIEETRTAVVIIDHALKKVKKGGHPLDAIGGPSSGLPAASRMAYLFGVDPNDDERRVLASAKSNLRERPKALAFEVDIEELPIVGEVPNLQYKEELQDFDANGLVVIDTSSGGGAGRRPDKRAAAAEWLTNYLVDKGGPIKSGTVQEDAKQNGITAKTVRRAADDLRIVRNPPGGGRNCTWDLPDDVKQIFGIATTEVPVEEPKEGDEVEVAKPPDDIDAEFAKLLDDQEGGENA